MKKYINNKLPKRINLEYCNDNLKGLYETFYNNRKTSDHGFCQMNSYVDKYNLSKNDLEECKDEAIFVNDNNQPYFMTYYTAFISFIAFIISIFNFFGFKYNKEDKLELFFILVIATVLLVLTISLISYIKDDKNYNYFMKNLRLLISNKK